MNRTRTLTSVVLGLAMLLAVVSPAAAQAQKGDNEVLVFGFVTSFLSSDFTSTTGTLNFSIGRFVNDRLQVGGGPTVSISSTSTPAQRIPTGIDRNGNVIFTTLAASTTVDTTLGVNGFLRQYFGASGAKVAPYVGGELFINDISAAGDQAFANGLGGVKSYLSEKAAIDFKGAFGFLLSDPGAQRILQFSVGITYLF